MPAMPSNTPTPPRLVSLDALRGFDMCWILGLGAVVKTLLDLVPEAEAMYPDDEITDRSERFLAGELVREQLMTRLGEELG